MSCLKSYKGFYGIQNISECFYYKNKKSQELKVYIVVYVIPKLSGVQKQDVLYIHIYTNLYCLSSRM